MHNISTIIDAIVFGRRHDVSRISKKNVPL